MATTDFIESLHIEDNVFELKEDSVLSYLVHYSAPFTGDGQISVPAGTTFAAHCPMIKDTFYMHPIEDDEILWNRMCEQEKAKNEKLANRLAGFSFYITEDEIKTLPLEFVNGSRERLLEIFQLISDEQAMPTPKKVEVAKVISAKQENAKTPDAVDDLPF